MPNPLESALQRALSVRLNLQISLSQLPGIEEWMDIHLDRWLEHIPTLTITKAFFLTLLCGVYALRAWTEERHLGMDPDYREYKKKVPWILFPGVY